MFKLAVDQTSGPKKYWGGGGLQPSEHPRLHGPCFNEHSIVFLNALQTAKLQIRTALSDVAA